MQSKTCRLTPSLPRSGLTLPGQIAVGLGTWYTKNHAGKKKLPLVGTFHIGSFIDEETRTLSDETEVCGRVLPANVYKNRSIRSFYWPIISKLLNASHREATRLLALSLFLSRSRAHVEASSWSDGVMKKIIRRKDHSKIRNQSTTRPHWCLTQFATREECPRILSACARVKGGTRDREWVATDYCGARQRRRFLSSRAPVLNRHAGRRTYTDRADGAEARAGRERREGRRWAHTRWQCHAVGPPTHTSTARSARRVVTRVAPDGCDVAAARQQNFSARGVPRFYYWFKMRDKMRSPWQRRSPRAESGRGRREEKRFTHHPFYSVTCGRWRMSATPKGWRAAADVHCVLSLKRPPSRTPRDQMPTR